MRHDSTPRASACRRVRLGGAAIRSPAPHVPAHSPPALAKALPGPANAFRRSLALAPHPCARAGSLHQLVLPPASLFVSMSDLALGDGPSILPTPHHNLHNAHHPPPNP